MSTMRRVERWATLNQAENAELQKMVEFLASEFGACLYFTGAPHPVTPNAPVEIRRAPRYDRRNLVRRAASWLRYTVSVGAQLFQASNVRRVLAVTNPPMLPHLCLLLRRLRGIRYAVIIWDLYPDHIVKMNWLRETHPIVTGWRRLNVHALRNADIVITIGAQLAEAIRAQLGQHASEVTIEVIPNWSDTETFRPIAKAANHFARTHNLVDKLTIMYSGNIGATHELEALIDAAAILQTDSGIQFMIIGTGLGRRTLEEKVRALALNNIIFLDPVPLAELPAVLAAADISVIAQAPESAHLSVPSKTYNALAVGSALLAMTSPSSDLAQLVMKDSVGEVCSPSDPPEISRAIGRIASDNLLLEGMRRRARESAVAKYSRAQCYSRFESVLRRSLFRE